MTDAHARTLADRAADADAFAAELEAHAQDPERGPDYADAARRWRDAAAHYREAARCREAGADVLAAHHTDSGRRAEQDGAAMVAGRTTARR